MQKILQIKVNNIGPIKGEKVVDFNPNALLTSLTGHNGVGKSTILKAIAQAQTGVLLCAKDDILNVHSKSGFIEATFLGVDGVSKFVHHIGFGRGEATWLQTPETEIRGAKEIGAYIGSFHSVSPRTLLKTNFVRQGDLSAIMSDLKSERAKVISELSGTDNAELVWKNLGDYVGRFNINDAAPAMYDRALDALKEAQALGETAKEQLKACPRVDDNEEISLHRAMSLFEKKRSAQAELAKLPKLEDLAAVAESLSSKVTVARKTAEDIRRKLKNIPIKEYRDTVANYQRAEEMLGQKSKYELLREKLDTWQKANPVRPEVKTEAPVALTKAHAQLESTIASIRTALKALGTGTCHACKQKIPHAHLEIEKNNKALSESEAQLAVMLEEIEKINTARAAELEVVAKYDKTYAQYTVKKAECDDFFARLTKLNPPEQEAVKTATAAILDHEQWIKDLGAAEKVESNLFNEMTNANTRLTETTMRVAEANKIISEGPSQQAFEDAKEKLSRITTLRRAYNEAEANVKVATFAITSKQKDVDEAKKLVDDFRKNQRIVTQLQAMRDLVHRDSLPAKISQQFLAKTALRAQEYLRPFEADFVLSADVGEMSFIAEYADGKRLRIDQLSGGWTTATALALRCATSDLISKINKTLILDECIVFLDADNMARIPMVLDKIKAVNKQLGRQMLMVTHEPNLLAVADSVISLD